MGRTRGKNFVCDFEDYPGLSLYIHNEKTGIMYYYFSHEGRYYKGSTGHSDRIEARREARLIYEAVLRGELTPKEKRKLERDKKKEEKVKGIAAIKCVEEYIKEVEENPKRSKKTVECYKGNLKWLRKYFKKTMAEDVTSKMLNNYRHWRKNYYKERIKKGNPVTVNNKVYKGVGGTSINRELGLLLSSLKYARNYLGIFQDKSLPVFKKYEEKKREEPLTIDEHWKVVQYFLKNDMHLHADICSFLVNTGLRYPNELNNLKWKHVHLKGNDKYILVKDRKFRGGGRDTQVPLITNAQKVLWRIWKRNERHRTPEDFVFIKSNGRKVDNIRKAFKTALKECEIDRNITMYHYRHSFATMCIERGDIPLKMISHSLGHADTTMLERVYGHLTDPTVKRVFRESDEKLQEKKKGWSSSKKSKNELIKEKENQLRKLQMELEKIKEKV